MSHPYLNFSISLDYKWKLTVGTTNAMKDGNGLTNKSVKNIEIPSSFNGIKIAEIGYRSFYNTSIESVFIPKSILSICSSAFDRCTKLADVRFEKGSKLNKLGVFVFWGCTSLKRIDFPSSISSIGIATNDKFFLSTPLECFSYLGLTNFSSLANFFDSVPDVYASSEYTEASFAGIEITGRDKTCDVSKEHIEASYIGIDYRHICHGKVSSCFIGTPIRFHHYMSLLIPS